jgi:hypothetical protein
VTIFNVSSVTQLTGALSKAQNGDVIQLASGTYSNVFLSGYKIAGNVTITSADPLHPAVLTDMLVKGSSGLTFKGLDLSNPVPGKDFAFQVQTSSNITLDHLTVHGPNNMGSGQEVGLMMVRGTTNVTVKDTEFFNGMHGLSMLDNNGLKVANNYFHDLRTDGVRGGGNSNLLVTQNTFTDFHPAAGDHPDAMQLWTNNTTTSASNITFADNLVVRGTGAPIQGVFMRDIVGNLPFQNVNITGNMIVGARYNGIAVEHVVGGNISGNTVAGYVGETSWMRADNSTGITLTNNNSTSFISQFQSAAGTNGNTLIPSIMDLGISVVSSWLTQHIGFSSHWGGSDLGLMGYLGLDAATLAATTAARSVAVTITAPPMPTSSTHPAPRTRLSIRAPETTSFSATQASSSNLSVAPAMTPIMSARLPPRSPNWPAPAMIPLARPSITPWMRRSKTCSLSRAASPAPATRSTTPWSVRAETTPCTAWTETTCCAAMTATTRCGAAMASTRCAATTATTGSMARRETTASTAAPGTTCSTAASATTSSWRGGQ